MVRFTRAVWCLQSNDWRRIRKGAERRGGPHLICFWQGRRRRGLWIITSRAIWSTDRVFEPQTWHPTYHRIDTVWPECITALLSGITAKQKNTQKWEMCFFFKEISTWCSPVSCALTSSLSSFIHFAAFLSLLSLVHLDNGKVRLLRKADFGTAVTRLCPPHPACSRSAKAQNDSQLCFSQEPEKQTWRRALQTAYGKSLCFLGSQSAVFLLREDIGCSKPGGSAAVNVKKKQKNKSHSI